MRSLQKTSALFAASLLVVCLLLEGLSAAYLAVSERPLPYGRPFAQTTATQPVAFQRAEAVFHPFAGYVLRATRIEDYIDGQKWQANNHGFGNLYRHDGLTCCDYVYEPTESEFVIGVFGGSVGAGYALSAQIAESFQRLGKSAPWQGKTARVLNFSVPGYKQPQQLMVLAYYVSLGQRFDLIINIDGFNEAVSTFRNWQSGVEPAYPPDVLWGAWGRSLEAHSAPPNEKNYFLGRYHDLSAQEAHQKAGSTWFASVQLYHEAWVNWHRWRGSAAAVDAITETDQRVYFPTAAKSPLASKEDMWTDTVDLWLETSISMAGLARQIDARYLHILQPNQWDREQGAYVPMDSDHPHGWLLEPVNALYPRFRAAGPQLRQEGVTFLDFSTLFSGMPPRDVYVDDCCHYTQKGNELLFERTMDAFLEGIAAEQDKSEARETP